MRKKLIALSSLVMVTMAPLMALAQTGVQFSGNATVAGTCGTGDIGAILCQIGVILNSAIPVIIVLGVFYFVWGVVSYVMSSDEEAKKTGKNRMIWGIIGLVVIVGMWGLVKIVTSTFGLSNNAGIVLPTAGTSL